MSNVKKKVLLMGKSGSGKTSMRSVIFSNMIASDTSRLGATIDVEHSHVRFLGSLVLNLWDCGGQEAFLDHYVSTQKSQIFSNVAILIYVFDATTQSGTAEWEKDVRYFEECLEALRSNEKSQGAGVWVLVNKMDLVGQEAVAGTTGAVDGKQKIFNDKREELERRANSVLVAGDDTEKPPPIRCFGTSIWDESLYKAWSSVIHTLIPNASLIKSHLTQLRDMSSCVEAVLFERQTFLVLAKSGSELDCDENELDKQEVVGGAKGLDRKRFEKISEVIKGFRQTCSRMGEPFVNWEAKFGNATVALDVLSSNTYLLLVSAEPIVEPPLLMFNIEQARKHFEQLSEPVITGRCSICKSHPECDYQPTSKGPDLSPEECLRPLVPQLIRRSLLRTLTLDTDEGPHTALLLFTQGQIVASATTDDPDFDGEGASEDYSGSESEIDEATGAVGELSVSESSRRSLSRDDQGDDADEEDEEPYMAAPERNRLLRGIAKSQWGEREVDSSLSGPSETVKVECELGRLLLKPINIRLNPGVTFLSQRRSGHSHHSHTYTRASTEDTDRPASRTDGYAEAGDGESDLDTAADWSMEGKLLLVLNGVKGVDWRGLESRAEQFAAEFGGASVAET